MTTRHRYTPEELDECALRDWQNDAECAERQAAEGPFYPERGITAESLTQWAAENRAKIAQHKNGGAHVAMLARG